MELLSHRSGDSYEQFIERVLPNPIARMVKRADLEDNMELRRLPGLTTKDLERLSRYRSAWARIVASGGATRAGPG